jgi:hypothetical protein
MLPRTGKVDCKAPFMLPSLPIPSRADRNLFTPDSIYNNNNNIMINREGMVAKFRRLVFRPNFSRRGTLSTSTHHRKRSTGMPLFNTIRTHSNTIILYTNPSPGAWHLPPVNSNSSNSTYQLFPYKVVVRDKFTALVREAPTHTGSLPMDTDKLSVARRPLPSCPPGRIVAFR